MPTLAVIRKRIKTVTSTSKITKAMKMIAAVKLRKMQHKAINARAYSEKMEEVVNGITSRIDTAMHPLMRKTGTIKKSIVIVATSDRGLCGGFNGNVTRLVSEIIIDGKKNNIEIDFIATGRKGRDFLRRRNMNMRLDLSGSSGSPDYSHVTEIANVVIKEFSAGNYDEVKFVYNKFVSVLSQKPSVERLLPLNENGSKPQNEGGNAKVIYEPSLQEILSSLLPKMIESRIYHILLESAASEHAARMTAMDSATNNAKDMIEHLTLVMHRARQSVITRELMDIVNGAEAMR